MNVPRIEVNPDAQSSAALSLAAGLIQLLTRKNVISKEDAIELYEALAHAKEQKAELHSNDIEAEAGVLLRHLGERLAQS